MIGDSIFFQDLDGYIDLEDSDRYNIRGSIHCIEDMDLDGDLDIVTLWGDEIRIYYGDGDTDKDGFIDPFDWFPNDPTAWDPRGLESGVS